MSGYAPDKVQICIRLPRDLEKQLRIKAVNAGWTQSYFVEKALRQFMKPQPKKPKETAEAEDKAA